MRRSNWRRSFKYSSVRRSASSDTPQSAAATTARPTSSARSSASAPPGRRAVSGASTPSSLIVATRRPSTEDTGLPRQAERVCINQEQRRRALERRRDNQRVGDMAVEHELLLAIEPKAAGRRGRVAPVTGRGPSSWASARIASAATMRGSHSAFCASDPPSASAVRGEHRGRQERRGRERARHLASHQPGADHAEAGAAEMLREPARRSNPFRRRASRRSARTLRPRARAACGIRRSSHGPPPPRGRRPSARPGLR